MSDLAASYRGFKLELEGTKGAFLAHVISLRCEARFIVAGNTAFGTVEEAFDLVDSFVDGAREGQKTFGGFHSGK